MNAGPWPYLLLILFVNIINSMILGESVSVLTMVEFGAMIVGLVGYVGFQGASGTDAAGVQAAIINAARSLSIVVFVASVTALSFINGFDPANVVLLFINLSLAGFAIFGAISLANNGA